MGKKLHLFIKSMKLGTLAQFGALIIFRDGAIAKNTTRPAWIAMAAMAAMVVIANILLSAITELWILRHIS